MGLCGSDLAVFKGTWTPPRYPWIQGHEAFGTIDAVGERVSADRIGEVVVVEPNVACFECGACRRGLTSSCSGRQSVGMNRPGALAEQLVVPSDNAWSIPGQAARDLVCVEPLAVIEAAFRRMGDPPIGTALVIGVGSQGLLATLSLVARGTAVLVHDVNPARVALAISLGARALDPDDAAVSVDLVVDTVGTSAAVDVALRHLTIGGTLLVLSLDATPFELSAQTHRPAPARHPGIADLRPPRGLRGDGRTRPIGRDLTGPGHHRRVPPGRDAGGVRAEPLRRRQDVDPCRRVSAPADASAALRRGDSGANAQEIAVQAEAGDLALRDGRDDRVVPERLPGVDVREVHLDDRHAQDREGVANGVV